MEFEYTKGTLKLSKVLSDLDKFVFDFVDMLEANKITYVIVSGYVSIILGRTRTTEDIDIFIKRIDFNKFKSFFSLMESKGYWILNATDAKEPFDMLADGLAIRVAEKGKAIPNFEIKFAKKDTDFLSLGNPLKVAVNDRMVLISPLEIQIPFKLWLGSDKDIEDAVHVYNIFKDHIDHNFLLDIGKRLNVEKEMNKYGIV